MRRVAVDRLVELLPRFGDGDAEILTALRRAHLNRILATPIENPLYKDVRVVFQPAQNREVQLRVAILAALERVGDSMALPLVQRLTSMAPTTAGERAIHAAANRCLPVLSARAQLARADRQLLRAAELPVPTSTHVRAAANNVAEPNRLVRPAAD
jgi:hypothetical protein